MIGKNHEKDTARGFFQHTENKVFYTSSSMHLIWVINFKQSYLVTFSTVPRKKSKLELYSTASPFLNDRLEKHVFQAGPNQERESYLSEK